MCVCVCVCVCERERETHTHTQRQRETDTDTDFIVKSTDPYTREGGGGWGEGGCTIAFLCMQSHNLTAEGKKQVYSMNHTFTRAVFLCTSKHKMYTLLLF